MSDENDKKDENDENNEPKFKLDKSDGGKEKEDNTPPEKILGKFETQEELAKAYQELEKRMSQNAPLTDLDAEQLAEKAKEFFSDVKTDTQLEGDLADWSSQITKDLGVPAPLVDSIVAKVSANTATGLKEATKKEAIAALEGDKELNDSFIDGLKAAGEDVDSWAESIDKGEVTVSMIKKFAKIAQFEPEAKSHSADTEPKMSEKEALDRVLSLINTRAYNDINHPDHKETRKQISFLEQKYGI